MLFRSLDVKGMWTKGWSDSKLADETLRQKIKREKMGALSLPLVPTPDILAEVGRRPGLIKVGFAAESGRGIRGTVTGRRLLLGNASLLQTEGVDTAELTAVAAPLRKQGAKR